MQTLTISVFPINKGGRAHRTCYNCTAKREIIRHFSKAMFRFNRTVFIFLLLLGAVRFQNVESTIDIFKIIEPTRRLYCQINCVDLNSWNFIWNSLCLKLCPELVLLVTTGTSAQTMENGVSTSAPTIMTMPGTSTSTGGVSSSTTSSSGMTMSTIASTSPASTSSGSTSSGSTSSGSTSSGSTSSGSTSSGSTSSG
ncbi:integumentary mucin C.1-like [Vespa crabro]|uniref:integumentary mucin C.1-like n=1 Tax=Vespa crabro TaxID=7445 RepID=UPI001EFF93D2|nr:integumentary mucin C.1-like [Vespa crabro]